MQPAIQSDDFGELSRSPVHALVFKDIEAMKVKDVLRAMKYWSNYTDNLIEKMVNRNLPEHFSERFGEISANLSANCRFAPAEIIVEGCSLRFPGGTYRLAYAASDRKNGQLLHEVRLEDPFLGEPKKIPAVLDALNLVPAEFALDLSEAIEPMQAIPALNLKGWTVLSQLPNRVRARHQSGYSIQFEPTALTFSGFTPTELWGERPDKNKTSLIQSVMLLVGKNKKAL